jgi:ribonuclease BN (tRNA processing enzyme)
VTVLGSGDAFGSGGRAHSAYLFEAPGVTFLLEAGPTILQSLKRAGRDPEAIDFVLVSHLHGDHFGGLPFLFLEYRYESRRLRPLPVYGPPGIARRTTALFAALYEEVAREPSPFPVSYQELTPGTPIVLDGVRVAPFPVPHVPDLVCLGFRIEVGGCVVIFSGDSGWTEEFVQQARGADLFLCECSTYETRLDIHLSYPEIAARAHDLGCRRLVLTHLGREPLAHVPGLSLECARDGMTLDLSGTDLASRRVTVAPLAASIPRRAAGRARARRRRR